MCKLTTVNENARSYYLALFLVSILKNVMLYWPSDGNALI